MLGRRRAIPDFPTIRESMPPAGYPKNTCPACTQGTSRTNPSLSYPGCPGPVHTGTPSPRPWVPDSVRCEDLLHQNKTLTVGPERAGSATREQQVFQAPIHKYVLRITKSVTCPRCLMQRPVLNRHGQGKQCDQAMPRVHGDTASYTHQYPNHIPARSPFFLSTIYIFQVIIIQ